MSAPRLWVPCEITPRSGEPGCAISVWADGDYWTVCGAKGESDRFVMGEPDCDECLAELRGEVTMLRRYEAWYGNERIVTMRMRGPGDMCSRIFEGIVVQLMAKKADAVALKQGPNDLRIVVEDEVE